MQGGSFIHLWKFMQMQLVLLRCTCIMCTCSQTVGFLVFRPSSFVIVKVSFHRQVHYLRCLAWLSMGVLWRVRKSCSILCIIWSADPLFKFYFACSLWFRFTCTFAIKQATTFGWTWLSVLLFFVSPSSLRRHLSW